MYPAHDECRRFGCQLNNLQEKLTAEMRRLYPERTRKPMRYTQALWCDFGNHDFSERDRGKKALTILGEDDDGNEVEESWTACSQHVPKGPVDSKIITGGIVDG